MYEEEGDDDDDDADEESFLILLYGTYFGFWVLDGSWNGFGCCRGSFLLLILSEASSNLDAGGEEGGEGDSSLILVYWTYFGF